MRIDACDRNPEIGKSEALELTADELDELYVTLGGNPRQRLVKRHVDGGQHDLGSGEETIAHSAPPVHFRLSLPG